MTAARTGSSPVRAVARPQRARKARSATVRVRALGVAMAWDLWSPNPARPGGRRTNGARRNSPLLIVRAQREVFSPGRARGDYPCAHSRHGLKTISTAPATPARPSPSTRAPSFGRGRKSRPREKGRNSKTAPIASEQTGRPRLGAARTVLGVFEAGARARDARRSRARCVRAAGRLNRRRASSSWGPARPAISRRTPPGSARPGAAYRLVGRDSRPSGCGVQARSTRRPVGRGRVCRAVARIGPGISAWRFPNPRVDLMHNQIS
jgi:hypothetical protein